jgi:hypothetical protein
VANSKEKTPAGKPGEKAQEPEGPKLVQVMQPAAFQMVISIIDDAKIKGSEAGNLIMLKNEMARVAGMTQNPA